MFQTRKASDLIKKMSNLKVLEPHKTDTLDESFPIKDRSTVDRLDFNESKNITNSNTTHSNLNTGSVNKAKDVDVEVQTSDKESDMYDSNVKKNEMEEVVLFNDVQAESSIYNGDSSSTDDCDLDQGDQSKGLVRNSVNLDTHLNNAPKYIEGHVDISLNRFIEVRSITSSDQIQKDNVLYFTFEDDQCKMFDAMDVADKFSNIVVIYFTFRVNVTLWIIDSKTKTFYSKSKNNLTIDELFKGLKNRQSIKGSFSCFGTDLKSFICNEIWMDGTEQHGQMMNTEIFTQLGVFIINDGKFKIPDIFIKTLQRSSSQCVIIIDKKGFRYIKMSSCNYLKSDLELLNYDFKSIVNQFIKYKKFPDCFSLKHKVYGSNKVSPGTRSIAVTGIKRTKAIFNTVPNLIMPFRQIDICSLNLNEGNQIDDGLTEVCTVNGLRWLSGFKGSLINLPDLGIYTDVFTSNIPIYVRELSNFGTGIIAIAALARKYGSYVVVNDEFIDTYDGDYTESYYFILGIMPKSLVPIYISLDYNDFMNYCYDVYKLETDGQKKLGITVAVCSSTGFLARFLALRFKWVKPIKVGSSFDLEFAKVEGTYKEVAKKYERFGIPGIDLSLLSLNLSDVTYMVTGFIKSVSCPVFKSVWESN